MPSVSVKCRQCGRQARAEEFVLDVDYRMMVCPQCIKEKRMKKEVYNELAKKKTIRAEQGEAGQEKPAGWDFEDAYLEQAYKSKVKNAVKAINVGAGKVKYKCPKCGYEFIYDLERKNPGRCSYCGENIHPIQLK